MKFLKYLTLVIIIYLLFLIAVFFSIDSPMVDFSQLLPQGKPNAVSLTLENLLPDLTYRIEAYLNKESSTDFIIEDKKEKIVYQSQEKFSEQRSLRFTQVSNQKKISFSFYEIPTEPLPEEIAYQKELDILRQNFLEKTLNDQKAGDSREFGKDIEIISRGGPFPGQEKLKPLPIPPKPTELKKVLARPVKNLKSLLIVNKLILTSYKNYLLKDPGFKIFYSIILLTVVFLILKTRVK